MSLTKLEDYFVLKSTCFSCSHFTTTIFVSAFLPSSNLQRLIMLTPSLTPSLIPSSQMKGMSELKKIRTEDASNLFSAFETIKNICSLEVSKSKM